MKNRIWYFLPTSIILSTLVFVFEQQFIRLVQAYSWAKMYDVVLMVIVVPVILTAVSNGLRLKGKLLLSLYLVAWSTLTISFIEIYFHFLGRKELFYTITTTHIALLIFIILDAGVLLPVYYSFVLRKIPARFKR